MDSSVSERLDCVDLYNTWKDQIETLIICLPTDGLIFSSTISMTIPLSSRPRRPARPLIWIYSPEEIYSHRTTDTYATQTHPYAYNVTYNMNNLIVIIRYLQPQNSSCIFIVNSFIVT